MTNTTQREADERELFEQKLRAAVREAEGGNISASDAYADSLLQRAPNGDYQITWVDSKWEGWQDRAAIDQSARQAAPEAPTSVTPTTQLTSAIYRVVELNNRREAWHDLNFAIQNLEALTRRATPAATTASAIGGQRWSKEAEMMESWSGTAPSRRDAPLDDTWQLIEDLATFNGARGMRAVNELVGRAKAIIARAPLPAQDDEPPSAKQEKLRALADRIDHEKLWKLPLMYRDSLTDAGRDRLDAGIALRRYAELLAPGRWIVFPPTGPVRFSASTLDKAYEMAKRDQDHAAMSHTNTTGGSKP